MAFNKTILMGRLTADVELRETASGHQVANFNIAVDRGYGEKKETDFFPVVAWNGMAETIAKHFSKGSQILVSGQLQNRQWEDNKGSKHTTTELIATEFSFCGTKENSSTHSSTESRTSQNKPILQAMDDDNDIPF
jgi:single-strand DNA-binding protein